MKTALLAIALVAIVALGAYWYRNERKLEAMRVHMEAYNARTSYTASAFPATVTFPRGGVMAVDYWGEMNWKGSAVEIATCSGDSDQPLYAEFYTAPAAFADAEHPLVKVRLGIVFTKASIPGQDAFHVIREETESGWRIRHTLVASPHGALVHPPEISPSVIANWPVAPGYVGQRFRMPGPEIAPPTPQMSRYEQQRMQRQQEYRAGEENVVNEERRKKHHHFAMVEAIKDFGDRRSVAIRKVGQYFGPKVFEQQAEEVKATMGKVRLGS